MTTWYLVLHQVVLVADPHLVTELLRDKTWDKSDRAYKPVNGVRLWAV